MITFKQYLLEASDGDDLRFENMDLQAAVEYAKKHCDVAMKNKVVFYRGEKSKGIDKIASVNPSLTKRVSQNTTNFYTVLMDNLPAYAKFPKRSASLICSTDPDSAASYSARYYAVIPCNGSKIGVAPYEDIWHTRVYIPTCSSVRFNVMNTNWTHLFKDLGLPVKGATYDNFKEIAKRFEATVDQEDSKDPRIVADRDVMDDFMRTFKFLNRSIDDVERLQSLVQSDFMYFLNQIYNPAENGCIVTTSAGFDLDEDDEREIWTDGPCLLVSMNNGVFTQFKELYDKK